ncbi:MAG: hypothetical protein JHC78_13355 [Ilumatobacteraceae bacterium]|nr:hypothetical protein [Ilumatobacteraceae bacterium]
MYFDEDDINFSRNMPEDTPPDGLTDCTDMNNKLLQLVELVDAVDTSSPNAEIEFCSAVSNLLYHDGPQLTEDNALGLLVGQVFVISTVLKAFDEDSKFEFLTHLEIRYAFAEDSFFASPDEGNPEDDQLGAEGMDQELFQILRECDFDESGARLEMMLRTVNLASDEDGDTDDLLHAQLMALLNFTIMSLLRSMDDECRTTVIGAVREAALELAEESWVPYHETPTPVPDIPVPTTGRAARRITFSMCFDSATTEEAIAAFVKSAETVLTPENKDVILKIETFDQPLEDPYEKEKPNATRYFDVDKNKSVLRKVLKKKGI